MKKFFENRKKATIFIVSIVLLLVIIAVIAIFATTSFAESSSIGKQNAQNFAFVDAGVAPDEVENLKTEFEFKNGQFIYEVEFDSNGTEYDYWVKASDGSIVKKEVDASDDITNQKQQEENNAQTNEQKGNGTQTSEQKGNGTQTSEQKENSTQKSETNVGSNNNKAENSQTNKQTNETNSKNTISLETAKSKALSDAGVSASKATFTKAKLDYDDGIQVYDIEFYTSNNKYEYEINAKTGAIYNKEIEAIKNKTTGNKTTNSSPSDNNSSYIGIDKAKSIALNHAGVSNVTFEKAKLDRDDGKTVYEIEFYKNGIEYSYEIDATTGKILEYDIDND